jgi:hypothetical protein
MAFLRFMAGRSGRAMRVLAGAGLVVAGALLSGGWYALVILGLVPLLAGALDVCVLAPLFGRPIQGGALRADLAR